VIVIILPTGVEKIGLFPAVTGFVWYNFWWATARHLATRPRPLLTQSRYYYEIWLAMRSCIDNVAAAWHTNSAIFTDPEAITGIDAANECGTTGTDDVWSLASGKSTGYSQLETASGTHEYMKKFGSGGDVWTTHLFHEYNLSSRLEHMECVL
jgi:hypothetical protein